MKPVPSFQAIRNEVFEFSRTNREAAVTDFPTTRMWQLPRPLFWLSALVLMIIFPFFFVSSGGGGGTGGSGHSLARAVWNLGHGGYFGLFTLVWLHAWSKPVMRKGWTVTLVVLVLGLLVEGGQSLVGRNPSLADVFRNLVGAWTVLVFWPGVLTLTRGRVLVRLAVAGLVALELMRWLGPVVNDVRLGWQVPVLFDQQSAAALDNWGGQVAWHSDVDRELENVMQISLGTARYSGARLDRLPGDWRGYETLSFRLYNPDDTELALTLRINDRAHDRDGYAHNDRFNTPLTVEPGWNQYRLSLSDIAAAPRARTMDMHQISQLAIFTSRLEQPRDVFLDDLRLE